MGLLYLEWNDDSHTLAWLEPGFFELRIVEVGAVLIGGAVGLMRV